MVTFAAIPTPHGHLCGDVSSALQKSIRRGNEGDALYFATELDLAGYGNYVWKRLRIIASEDVGLAEPMACVQVRALYENWLEQSKAEKREDVKRFPSRIFLVHAVMLLCRARKSRAVDHATITHYLGDRDELRRAIPDYAYDHHTQTGKRMGRGWEFFFGPATELQPEGDVPDPYKRAARNAVVR